MTPKFSKPPTPEAKQALDQLLAELGVHGQDDRSAMTRLMSALAIRCLGVAQGRKAITALRENFVDWNEIRICERREVVSVLAASGTTVEQAQVASIELQSALTDVYNHCYVVNFEFEVLDEAMFSKLVAVEGQEPPPDLPTIRDEGLPKHPTIAGFLDAHRLLTETTKLDGKLLRLKNTDQPFVTAFENPGKPLASIVWAVAMRLGIVTGDVLPAEAMRAIREGMGDEQVAFASASCAFYERNSRTIDKYFKQQTPMPEEDVVTPFSVQLGLVNPEDVPRAEPPMPRSEGMERPSKLAKVRVPDSSTSSRMPSVALAEAPASSSKSSRRTARKNLD